MGHMPDSTERLAVLIDADNTSPKHASALFDELAKYGTATVKRAYGDWSSSHLAGWRSELNRLAIVPVQQPAYTTGKNSSDVALVIDAMDLLHTGNVDGFALVSSDSDFTRLATRLRESGKAVYGLGMRKTPASLVAAVDRFIYLEVLGDEQVDRPEDATSDEAPLPNLQGLLTRAINAASGDDGAVSVSALGNYLRSASTSFDPRLYGQAKLSALLQAQPYLTVTGAGSAMEVSLKSRPPAKKTAARKATKRPPAKKQGQPSE
jgi:uncharacterized LabA/DUF88 family protein